jgi:hypothetical protein
LKLNDAQRFALKEIVETGPIPAVYGVVRWRLVDLVQWLYEESRIGYPTESSSLTIRSSISALTHGNAFAINLGASWPSACATGLMHDC